MPGFHRNHHIRRVDAVIRLNQILLSLLMMSTLACASRNLPMAIVSPQVDLVPVPNARLAVSELAPVPEVLLFTYLETTETEFWFVEDLLHVADAFRVSRCKTDQLRQKLSNNVLKCTATDDTVSTDAEKQAKDEFLADIAKEIPFIFFALVHHVVTDSRNSPSKYLSIQDAISLVDKVADGLRPGAGPDDFRVDHRIMDGSTTNPIYVFDTVLDAALEGLPVEIEAEVRGAAAKAMIEVMVQNQELRLRDHSDQIKQAQEASTKEQEAPPETNCMQAVQLHKSVQDTLEFMKSYEDTLAIAIKDMYEGYQACHRELSSGIPDFENEDCGELLRQNEEEKEKEKEKMKTNLQICNWGQSELSTEVKIALTLHNDKPTSVTASSVRMKVFVNPGVLDDFTMAECGSGEAGCPSGTKPGMQVKVWATEAVLRAGKNVAAVLEQQVVVSGGGHEETVIRTNPLDHELSLVLMSCFSPQSQQPKLIYMYKFYDKDKYQDTAAASGLYARRRINQRYLCPEVSLEIEILDNGGRRVAATSMTLSELAAVQRNARQ
jgi:hypothetical protein